MDLMIQETKNTPGIFFNEGKNEWVISGKSYPRGVREFYKPVFNWLDTFDGSISRICTFQFKFEFFNTATTQVILDILFRLKEMEKTNNVTPVVKWYYEEDDEDMMETGESIMGIAGIPFEMVSYHEK